MKKFICCMLMALVGFGALADGVVAGGRIGRGARAWVPLFSDAELTAYAFPNTIRTHGEKAYMWSLVDFKAPQSRAPATTPFLSEKFEDEYDCFAKQFRTLSFSMHPANMGAGPAIYGSSEPSDWQPIMPESDVELSSALACENAEEKPPGG